MTHPCPDAGYITYNYADWRWRWRLPACPECGVRVLPDVLRVIDPSYYWGMRDLYLWRLRSRLWTT